MPKQKKWSISIPSLVIPDDQSETGSQDGDLPSGQNKEKKHPPVNSRPVRPLLGRRHKLSSIIFTATLDLLLSCSAIIFFVLAAYANIYDPKRVDNNGAKLLDAAQIVCSSFSVFNDSNRLARVLLSFLSSTR